MADRPKRSVLLWLGGAATAVLTGALGAWLGPGGILPGGDASPPKGPNDLIAAAPTQSPSTAVSPSAGVPVVSTAASPRPSAQQQQPQQPQSAPSPKAKPKAPCIVGTWHLSTIVDFIDDVRLSYDHGTETRTYRTDGTFSMATDWTEVGYTNTLEEVVATSKGTASGRYSMSGATATYSSVSSVGNWTKKVAGEVRSQSSVVFSSGQEKITCSSGALRVEDPGSYWAEYTR